MNMNQLTIELPIVKYAENFTFEDLKQLILQTPVIDWTESHGQSSLTFIEDGSEKRELSYFAGLKGEGFLIRHSNLEDVNDRLYVCDGAQSGKICKYVWSGQAEDIFCEYLVSKKVLLDALEYFMQTGERNPKLNWQDVLVPEFAEV